MVDAIAAIAAVTAEMAKLEALHKWSIQPCLKRQGLIFFSPL